VKVADVVVDRETQVTMHPDDIDEADAIAAACGKSRPTVIGEAVRDFMADVTAATSQEKVRIQETMAEAKRLFKKLPRYDQTRAAMSYAEKWAMGKVADDYKVSNLVLLRIALRRKRVKESLSA